MTDAQTIFEAEGIVKRFGGLSAVDGATLSVREGSLTALIGPNGAGKTTFFNVITGFYRAEGGRAVFAGRDIHRRSAYQIARLGMVRTFQITKAFAAMPVIENMMLAAPQQPGERLLQVARRPLAVRRREHAVRSAALELLDTFNLAHLGDAYAGTLSGGQRKLLELARALMARPQFLLLDEPMAGINPALGVRLLEHIERLRAEHGMTFLFIEHDMDMVMRHSDRVIVMAQGRVIADGTADEVRRDPAVIDAYLGSSEANVDATEGAEAAARTPAEPRSAFAPPNGETLLETEGLVAGYVPDVNVLDGVSIRVDDGEIVTVVGPNGAGKSTLIKTIFGLLSAREGRITFRGESIIDLKPHDITRRGLSYVPQLNNVFPSLTVEENLEMGSLDPTRTRAQIDRMFELFPRLGERRRQPVGTMSGGERQMVAMGRALMPDPDVLLLDEPSAGLAPSFVDVIFDKITEVNSNGVTVVMVEQNARRALAMSHRGYVLDLGRERFEGNGRDLIADAKVAELYLGGTARIDHPESAIAGEPRPSSS